jgi:hypothetical protein
MSQAAAVIAAVAATVSALLALSTLLATGRREERKCRRDALQRAVLDFLDSSHSSPGTFAFVAARNSADLTAHRAAAEEAHRRQNDARGLLRLIAPADVVIAADALHRCDEDLREAALGAAGPVDERRWSELRGRQNIGRRTFILAARKAFGAKGEPPRPWPDHSRAARSSHVAYWLASSSEPDRTMSC